MLNERFYGVKSKPSVNWWFSQALGLIAGLDPEGASSHITASPPPLSANRQNYLQVALRYFARLPNEIRSFLGADVKIFSPAERMLLRCLSYNGKGSKYMCISSLLL